MNALYLFVPAGLTLGLVRLLRRAFLSGVYNTAVPHEVHPCVHRPRRRKRELRDLQPNKSTAPPEIRWRERVQMVAVVAAYHLKGRVRNGVHERIVVVNHQCPESEVLCHLCVNC